MTIPASGPVSMLDVINEMKGPSAPYGDDFGGGAVANSINEFNEFLLGVSPTTSASLNGLRGKTITHKVTASTVSDSAAIWINDSNVDDSVGAYTLVNASGEQGTWLIARNWGFAIPGGDTVRGIVVTLEAKVDYAGDGSGNTQLWVAAMLNGVQPANDTMAVSLTTSFLTYTFGGADTKHYSSLWGAGWSAGNINSVNFGVLLKANRVSGTGGYQHTVSVRNLRVRVHHSA